MASGNGGGLYRILGFLLLLGAAIVGAVIGVEARIDANVAHEEMERKDADVAVEQRQEQRMERIEKKLDGIERYIREQ